MNLEICPKYRKCPIFLGKPGSSAQGTYKNMYCTAGTDKFTTCKRYIVSEKTKVAVPHDIMPNSFFSVEEILEIMREDGLID